MLKLINDTQLTGCNCGNTVMPPVAPVGRNANLTLTAIAQSKYMLSINKCGMNLKMELALAIG